MPERPQNICHDCQNTWYPRGKDISDRCPRCKSTNIGVFFGHSTSTPTRSKSGGVLGGMAIVGIVAVVLCCGGIAGIVALVSGDPKKAANNPKNNVVNGANTKDEIPSISDPSKTTSPTKELPPKQEEARLPEIDPSKGFYDDNLKMGLAALKQVESDLATKNLTDANKQSFRTFLNELLLAREKAAYATATKLEKEIRETAKTKHPVNVNASVADKTKQRKVQEDYITDELTKTHNEIVEKYQLANRAALQAIMTKGANMKW